ncbi:PorT family protein [Riemerella anatipestifer]|uniref:porin family protein n=1 Tax=Riemerella anatipestifer TaxID=34085 RepID=UPI0007ED5E19|nr:porin family protein [Riemerella anatipestifer]MCW0487436.1 PorT family protein [Riemerella anatipestifer]MCW0497839.1 PorT family protein [Riemerella anatipestifer]MDD1548784.1 PorT family protein [Riemerella anatipestifer]MDR7831797.1 porin family protein [Riemerella anatipestifer]OBP62270.1 hypothetical protein AWB84_09410 [Riemerella anatipestifer]
MKKVFLLGALALYSVTNAQLKFGGKAGYALSEVGDTGAVRSLSIGGTSISSSSSSTFYAGFLAEYKFTNKWAVQGEILYSPLKGVEEFNSKTGSIYTDKKLTYTLNNLLVPVSAKYYVIKNLALSGGFNLGVILSANVKENSETNLSGTVKKTNNTTNIKKGINSFDFSPFIGAEYNFSNGLFLDTRYNIGVSDLSKSKDDNIKSRFWQIGLGYKF